MTEDEEKGAMPHNMTLSEDRRRLVLAHAVAVIRNSIPHSSETEAELSVTILSQAKKFEAYLKGA